VDVAKSVIFLVRDTEKEVVKRTTGVTNEALEGENTLDWLLSTAVGTSTKCLF
jgi:hypothetical protein